MSDDYAPRPIGTEANGYVWNGAAWVPRIDGSGSTFDGTAWHPPRRIASSATSTGPMPGYAFTDPHYGYGLTRQTSDDLQFIVRFQKVMIWVWISMVILTVVPAMILLMQLFALIAALSAWVPR